VLHKPLDEVFGNKAHHAKGQAQKDDKGAELTGLGLPCKMTDDEQHVEHEAPHAKAKTKGCKLLFRKTKH